MYVLIFRIYKTKVIIVYAVYEKKIWFGSVKNNFLAVGTKTIFEKYVINGLKMIFLRNKKKNALKKYYIFSSKFITEKILPQLDLMYSKMSKQSRKSN